MPMEFTMPLASQTGVSYQNGFSISTQAPGRWRASARNFIGDGYSRLAPTISSGRLRLKYPLSQWERGAEVRARPAWEKGGRRDTIEAGSISRASWKGRENRERTK